MLANKLDAVKEKVQAAQTRVLAMLATVPSSEHSNKLASLLSDAMDSTLQSINDPSSEGELIYLCSTMISICTAIKLLALSPYLAQIDLIHGVLVNSTLKDMKMATTAIETAKIFAMKTEEEQDPYNLNRILNAYYISNVCLTEFNLLDENYKEKETIVELSNALKVTCSAIKCSASKIALNNALGNDTY